MTWKIRSTSTRVGMGVFTLSIFCLLFFTVATTQARVSLTDLQNRIEALEEENNEQQNQIDNIELTPGPQGPPGVSPNQSCDDNSLMVGIDDNGDIVCSELNIEQLPAKYIFVTSETYQGDLGGSAGADQKCNIQAQQNTKLNGRYFKAWISDSKSQPYYTFKQYNISYKLVDGTTIANSWNELATDRIPLKSLINKDQNGNDVFNNYDVWTNTEATGLRWSTYPPRTCHDFTQIHDATAMKGTTTCDSSCWTLHHLINCNAYARLYCIEQ